METLLILTHLTIVLLFGIIFTLISRRLKVPHILMLLFAGIFLGSLSYGGEPLIHFPAIFVDSVGVLALVLVVFDGASRFKWKEFDSLTLLASKMTLTFLVLNIVFLTIFTTIIFNIENVFLALIFAALMSGTSADAVLLMFKEKGNKITNLLEVESLINTPITVLLPFIIIGVVQKIGIGGLEYSEFIQQFLAIIQQFVIGIGAGVMMGLIVFKIMKRYYSHRLSPILLITSTLLTYILAENLSGNGVLAVTILGLFFGNLYVKKKQLLFEFSSTFGNSLMILVFVLVGIRIPLPLNDFTFIASSLILFLFYVAIRSMSIYVSTTRENITIREKIFLTLNVPKGIAVAVIVFSLGSYIFNTDGFLKDAAFSQLPGAELILNLALMFMIYSLILSTIANHFSKFFLKVDMTKTSD